MHVGPGDRDGHGGHEVAVLDQLDARTRRADFLDERLVAWPVEDHDREVVDLPVERVGDDLQVLLDRAIEIDLALRGRAHDELFHVRIGRVEQSATLGDRKDRDRIRAPMRDGVGALERIDGDIDLGADALADLFADIQHRRLVSLAFTDDDAPVERDLVHRPAHGFHGRLVGLVLLAVTHPVGCGDRRSFRDPDQFEARCAFDHDSQR